MANQLAEKITFKKPFERLSNVNTCKVIQVIEVKSLVGVGDGSGTPKREINEYFTTSGELLARRDMLIEPTLENGVWTE
jgi:hypothetical protein